MSTTSASSFAFPVGLPSRAALGRDQPLWLVALGCGLLAALIAPAVGLDHRTVGGVNVWLKPLKFLLSFGVFSASMAWLLGYLTRAGRARAALGQSLAAIIVFEIAILLVQAARGTASHFNTSHPLDAAMFYAMGGGVIVLTAILLKIWIDFGSPLVEVPPALRAGIRAGLALFLLGTMPGWTMIAYGAHTVGAADGGPGLPWLNWSIVAGDLRIAHFVGLHALQVLPLAGALLGSRGGAADGLAERRVLLAAVLYAALIVGTFALALAGLPLWA